MKVIVAVETSTLAQSVALAVDGAVVASRERAPERGHSRDLSRTIAELLANAGLSVGDVDAFAVDVGPGSFTGLRVGLSLVKGLAAVTGASVLPVRSVDAVAAGVGGDAPVAIAFDAHNKLVYAAAVVPFGKEVVGLDAWEPPAFAAACADAGVSTYVGDGWARYADRMPDTVPLNAIAAVPPRAAHVAEFAIRTGVDPVGARGVEPIYVRKSAAEERRATRATTRAT